MSLHPGPLAAAAPAASLFPPRATDIPYRPGLDGLRALSCLVVVFFHCWAPFAGGGFVGVDVFFVISGYLITTMLAGEAARGGIRVGRFYARRAVRLYPTLLLLVVAYLALAPVLWPADRQWLYAGLAAFYLTDYSLGHFGQPLIVGHSWSLAVEEKFYLLWPLVLPFVLRARRPVAWLVAAFVAATAWRCFTAVQWGWPQAYFTFDARLSGLMLGAIAAVARPKVSGTAAFVAAVALAAVIAVPTLPSLPFHRTLEATTLVITMAELSAFLLVCRAAQPGAGGLLAWPPLTYVGRLSYGIYLWHFPAVVLLRDVQPLWITAAGTLLFAGVMAALCLHLVDEPLRRWRQKRWPKERTDLTASRLPAR
jgi:peptidoglycan/LPS O-acetylase OafA/YrhL